MVVLHSEQGQEAVREEALQTLRLYKASPVLEVSDFTYRLRRERINLLLNEHVSRDDWVVHADLDEFHIYPSALQDFLDACDATGYSFILGEWADRIAANRRLVPIKRSPSLWCQFPLVAELSTLSGGWVRKVCAAKGFHRSGDGGTHSVDLGLSSKENYAQSVRHKECYPTPLTIDHFKWDSTVIQRLERRLHFYRSKGLKMYQASERLLMRLPRNGELDVPAKPSGRRDIYYTRPSLLPTD